MALPAICSPRVNHLKDPQTGRFSRGARFRVTCPWLGCSESTEIYRSQVAWGGKRGKKIVFCEQHRALVRELLGRDVRMNGFGRVFANPDEEYAIRMPQGISLRVAVYVLSERCCKKCGLVLKLRERTWQIDHRVPLAKGGKTILSNLQALCVPCHKEKSRVETVHFKRHPATYPMSKLWWMTHAQKDVLIKKLQHELEQYRTHQTTTVPLVDTATQST